MNVMQGGLLVWLIILAWIDIKVKKIPVIFVWVAGLLVLVYQLWHGSSLIELLLGVLPGLILIFLSFCTKGGIGLGDGLVLSVLGLMSEIQQIVAVLGLAFLLEAVIAISLLVLKKAGRKTELAFLPCVLAGYICVLLL